MMRGIGFVTPYIKGAFYLCLRPKCLRAGGISVTIRSISGIVLAFASFLGFVLMDR